MPAYAGMTWGWGCALVGVGFACLCWVNPAMRGIVAIGV